MKYPGLQQTKFKELALLFLGKRERFRVAGDSMHPLLHNDDVVLLCCLHSLQDVHVGDVIIFTHPFKNIQLIKKVRAVRAEGVEVIGNAIESNDSRSFGFISIKHVTGKVTSKL